MDHFGDIQVSGEGNQNRGVSGPVGAPAAPGLIIA